MLAYIFSFLVLLNPFALFIYLVPLYKEQGLGTFFKILAWASLISFVIYGFFAVYGQNIFNVLQVNFEAFRIFGGIVLLSFALVFILQGKKSFITTKGEISSIASEIALPFIVGAGTITLSILIGENFNDATSILILFIIMVLNYIFVAVLMIIRDKVKNKYNKMFDNYAEILLRLSGFIVGSYGVGLIISGIENLVA
jgi:multiple antibiotic resistance protein